MANNRFKHNLQPVLSQGSLLPERPSRPLRSTPNFFGIADRLGMLEAGKLAEVIATPSDPTADIRQTKRAFFAMKGGDYL